MAKCVRLLNFFPFLFISIFINEIWSRFQRDEVWFGWCCRCFFGWRIRDLILAKCVKGVSVYVLVLHRVGNAFWQDWERHRCLTFAIFMLIRCRIRRFCIRRGCFLPREKVRWCHVWIIQIFFDIIWVLGHWNLFFLGIFSTTSLLFSAGPIFADNRWYRYDSTRAFLGKRGFFDIIPRITSFEVGCSTWLSQLVVNSPKDLDFLKR